MKYVSREERNALDLVSDPKARTRKEIGLADLRLTRAEQYTNQGKFVLASEEFGCYAALIEDILGYIGQMDSDKGRTRDLYRHVDIALRAHIPRLVVMRRTTPLEYAMNIKAAEEYARDARTRALESFYGHGVVRENPEKDKKPERPPPEIKQP